MITQDTPANAQIPHIREYFGEKTFSHKEVLTKNARFKVITSYSQTYLESYEYLWMLAELTLQEVSEKVRLFKTPFNCEVVIDLRK